MLMCRRYSGLLLHSQLFIHPKYFFSLKIFMFQKSFVLIKFDSSITEKDITKSQCVMRSEKTHP